MKAPTLLLLFLTVAFAACATIVHGTRQEVDFSSDPVGATILINGEQRGVTPTAIALKRGRDHQVIFQMDGYEDLLVNVDKQMDVGWYLFGNLFSWGVIGWVVDIANGAAYKLSEDEVYAAMREEQMGIAPGDFEGDFQLFVLTPAEAISLGIDPNSRKNYAR